MQANFKSLSEHNIDVLQPCQVRGKVERKRSDRLFTIHGCAHAKRKWVISFRAKYLFDVLVAINNKATFGPPAD